MNRNDEIREKERELREARKYNFRSWIKTSIIPADKSGWNWLLISGGDVRSKMHLNHSDLTRSRCKVVVYDGIPHTVLEMRTRFLSIFKRAKDFRSFYKLLKHYIAEDDIRVFHYDLWLAGHNLEAKVNRLAELQIRSVRRATEIEREVFGNTSVRVVARHCRDF